MERLITSARFLQFTFQMRTAVALLRLPALAAKSYRNLHKLSSEDILLQQLGTTFNPVYNLLKTVLHLCKAKTVFYGVFATTKRHYT
ncbi:hypothetical protein L596_021468 [Steinernema carpocapsae]|uniref:Uncharacterized protein n=1 Tax=Steinernema carpocapsae TaxID=34508 RepID=A0A4U5MIX1_STECR|nr:hypothetical protein L596_021468 [Steinernema carpocapsae]